MSTNKVKHAMFIEAKKIANTEFKSKKITNEVEGELVTFIIDKKYMRDAKINEILDLHPEFNPNTFRQMIKEIEVRNKQKEE